MDKNHVFFTLPFMEFFLYLFNDRGLGFQPLRHIEMLKKIKALGKQRLFGFVDHLNFSSLRGVMKSGYVVVGEIRFRRKSKQTTILLKTSPGFSPTRREISHLSVTPPHGEDMHRAAAVRR